jgi:hypothetical protein
MYTLIATALCRMRHRAVYAASRTMPMRHMLTPFGLKFRAVGSA